MLSFYLAVTQQNTQQPNKRSGGLWIVVVVLALIGLLLMGTNDNDDRDRTCAWCNGTGYSGNGAQTVEEYVFMKTPCKHCNGKGTY